LPLRGRLGPLCCLDEGNSPSTWRSKPSWRRTGKKVWRPGYEWFADTNMYADVFAGRTCTWKWAPSRGENWLSARGCRYIRQRSASRLHIILTSFLLILLPGACGHEPLRAGLEAGEDEPATASAGRALAAKTSRQEVAKASNVTDTLACCSAQYYDTARRKLGVVEHEARAVQRKCCA
jgi:hypothetical protein